MRVSDLTASDAALYQAALLARSRAYAPYSHFAVGAALLAASGVIYSGANVENSSYGLSNCAERTAVFSAVAAGERQFTALCVVAATPEPVTPCGACRQVLAEFGVPRLILANLAGAVTITTLEALLPGAFSLAKPDALVEE